MLHIDIFGAVLALGIFYQHDTDLIIAIQSHAIDDLSNKLEFI